MKNNSKNKASRTEQRNQNQQNRTENRSGQQKNEARSRSDMNQQKNGVHEGGQNRNCHREQF